MPFEIEVTEDFATCFALRRKVFIEEQDVPEEEELDELDAEATHFLGRQGGQPVATARVVVQEGKGKIGRVCVLAECRGAGLGARLMEAIVAHLAARGDVREAVLGAQLHALSFYERLGFEAFGDVFDDAGIDHRMMRKPLR